MAGIEEIRAVDFEPLSLQNGVNTCWHRWNSLTVWKVRHRGSRYAQRIGLYLSFHLTWVLGPFVHVRLQNLQTSEYTFGHVIWPDIAVNSCILADRVDKEVISNQLLHMFLGWSREKCISIITSVFTITWLPQKVSSFQKSFSWPMYCAAVYLFHNDFVIGDLLIDLLLCADWSISILLSQLSIHSLNKHS